MSRLAIALLAVAACASNQPKTLVVPTHDGTYSFRERSADDPGFSFEGTFVVLGDTVTIDATPGPCVYDPRVRASGPITYRCGDVTVGFDRPDPVNRASYSYMGTSRTSERVCDQSSTDGRGRQACARSHMEIKETPQMRYGRLSPVRLGDAPARP